MKPEDMCIGTCSAMQDDVDPEVPEWNDWMTGIIRLMQQREQQLRHQGYSVALIDPEPMHLSSFELSNFMDAPDRTCRRQWRLDLIGGGQVRLVEHYEEGERTALDLKVGLPPTWLRSVKLAVIAPYGAKGMIKGAGFIEQIIGEASMMAVALRAPQEVTDRVAATLRAIDNVPDNFYALLSARQRCAACNRPLADEISKLVGVGPDCARRHGIPHSLTAASRRLELRRQLGAESNAIRDGLRVHKCGCGDRVVN